MLKILRSEIRDRVETALKAGQNIDIADVHITVIDLDSEVNVQGFGRMGKPTDTFSGHTNTVTAEVLNQIKSKFRDAGPEAALKAVQNS